MSNGLRVNDISPVGERPGDRYRGRVGASLAGVDSLVGIDMVGTLGPGQVWVYDSVSDTLVPGYVEDLGTAETDTTLVLAPDGTGGVDWVSASSTAIPTTIGTPVTLYVNASTGNDTTGDGTVGLPYASIGRALEDVPTIVTANHTIDVADGTYYEQVNLDRFLFPAFATSGPARIVLDGNTTTPANCVISGASSGATTTPIRDFCIYVTRAYAAIQGFKLQYASARGLQATGFNSLGIGPMAYDHCGDGMLISTYTLAVIYGNQTISNVANGIYLTEFGRLNTDAGSRTITMTGITNRGLYVVESTILLNGGDSLSITAAGSGTRTAGIEGDGIGTLDLPVTVSISGSFTYGIVAGGGSHIHVSVGALTISGAGTTYFANEYSTVWDVDALAFLAGGPAGGLTGFATPAIVLGTAAAAGAATTAIRSDSTIVAFDATVPAAIGTAATGAAAKAARRDHVHPTGAGTPSTQAVGDAAVVGSGPAAAMDNHKHAITRPALDDLSDVVITSVAAGDRVRYDGSNFVNSALRWEPHVAYDGTVVLDGNGDPVMVEVI